MSKRDLFFWFSSPTFHTFGFVAYCTCYNNILIIFLSPVPLPYIISVLLYRYFYCTCMSQYDPPHFNDYSTRAYRPTAQTKQSSASNSFKLRLWSRHYYLETSPTERVRPRVCSLSLALLRCASISCSYFTVMNNLTSNNNPNGDLHTNELRSESLRQQPQYPQQVQSHPIGQRSNQLPLYQIQTSDEQQQQQWVYASFS